MKAFRPQDEGLERRLYDFVYTSVYYAITNFSKDSRSAAMGGYKIAYIIRQAAEDAVDDVLRRHMRKKSNGK